MTLRARFAKADSIARDFLAGISAFEAEAALLALGFFNIRFPSRGPAIIAVCDGVVWTSEV